VLLIKNIPFANVVASGVATVSLPIGMTYNRIFLILGGGAFTKAMLTDFKVKLNGTVISNTTGAKLDTVNTYRGLGVTATVLVLDFTEPKAKTYPEQYVGDINTAKGVSSLNLEVTIAGATTPSLDSYSELGRPQELGVIAKLLSFTQAFAAAGKIPIKLIDIANKGAIVKRVHFTHTGAITALEVKKNGIVIFDNIPTAVNTAHQLDYGHVAQANCYTYDPCVDNNYSQALTTADMISLEFNPTFSGADTVTALLEVLDVLGNM
jgi:hypothetical protein